MLRCLLGRLCLFALGCSLLDPFAPLARANEAIPLRIGEVAWAGSSLSTADEWIELWNTGDSPLSLTGFKLEGASASPIVFDATHVIAPQSTFLISNYDSSDSKSTIATTTPFVDTSVSLSNSTLHLQLFDPQGILVDEVAEGVPPAGSSSPKATMIRSVLDTTWVSATTTALMKTGIADFGTPGLCDGCITQDAATPPVIIPEPEIETDPEAELEDATIPEEQSTSTEPTPEVIEPLEEITTTQIIVEEPSSTVEIVETEPTLEAEPDNQTEKPPTEEMADTSATPSVITPITSVPTSLPTVPAPGLKLQAVFPAPDNAQEWIDLTWTNDTRDLARLDGWSLQNGRSKVVFRFSTSTRPNLTEHDGFIRITFKSAVLLNTGDTVSLYDASNALADRMSYTTTPKGSTWTFDGAWQNPDLLPQTTTTTITATVTSSVPTSTVTVAKTSTVKTPTITKKETAKSSTKTDKTEKPATKTTATKTSATKKTTSTTKKTTPTTKKTTVSKTALANIIHPFTIEQILMQPQSLRVRVQGVVGTVPGILLKRQFVLQAPDGRGLLIKLPTGHKTPKLGSTIELTGSITEDDDGVILTMKAQDHWNLLSTDQIIIPSRTVDLLAEETEDTWSKISVTGTILSISAGKAELDIDGIHLTAIIKAATHYRVQRLQKGDTIHLTGVLTFTKDGPTLYPVTAEDITVIKNAALAKPATKTSMPDWIPFGAAGATVAAYEGFKRWRKRKPLTKEVLTIA